MPTGYTAIIEEGDGATFEQFVWTCARAFGALIHMRDESNSAPITDPAESSYYAESIAKDRARLALLEAMTPEEADRAADLAYTAAAEGWRTRVARARTLSLRYAAMRSKVEGWAPPTNDHAELRKFMLQQIDLCAKDGFGPYGEAPRRTNGASWRREQISDARRDLAYHEKALREEQERIASRRAWVNALRESVPMPPAPVSGKAP